MSLKHNFQINSTIQHFIQKNSKKKYKIMYHATSEKNAKSILKNGFDLSKSKTFAFGRGINLTNSIQHLNHYLDKTNNTILVCLVKYNKLKYNPPYYKNIKSKECQEFLQKHGYTKPSFMKIPTNYDGFYYHDIFVMKKTSVKPFLSIKVI